MTGPRGAAARCQVWRSWPWAPEPLLSLGVTRSVGSLPGPGFVPQIAAVLLAISGAIAALRSMLEVRSEPGATDSSETTLWRAIGTIVALACFVGLFEWAGFLLATPLLLGATAWLAGAKKWGDILALAVGGTAVFYWLFAKVLSSQLPVGLLGS